MTTPAEGGAVREAAAEPQSLRAGKKDWRGWLFVGPFVVLFALFLVWPMIHGLYLSFTGESLTGANGQLIGFDNYAEAFSDPVMWHSLWNTVWFTVLSTIPLVVVALGLALLVHQVPGQWFWRLSFFMPYLLASTVVAQFWIWMYNPQLGLVNDFLGNFGVEPIAWLQDESWAMISVVVTTLWWTIGFNFLLYLAAIQNIPEQQFEAAALDGASRIKQAFRITIPQLWPTTVLVLILQVLASLKVFDQIYMMTNGGPAGATRPIVQYVFEVGFTGYRFGYASAISYIFFALIVLVSLVQFRITNRRNG
ncbi:carbohydrate ABC transporter permease [Cellulomonas sp. PhB143]|uniref:carbohydrate ABC transporter permease n=1 Tax=Cellulomonas sp. PhB143 TaxID=2485186 RepID=UPI000F48B051|nr:sugar ABC transporter permease [Cellulomonas sp. PhB143]